MSVIGGELFLPAEEDTLRCGKRLGAVSDCLGMVFLQGALGAGKTTLSRGVLNGLGHAGAVRSPTYTLVESYDLETGQVLHLDLYRLEGGEELEDIGIRDYLGREALYLVEWPERGVDFLPPPDLHLHLFCEGEGRRLRWTAPSVHGRLMAGALTVAEMGV